MFSSIWSIRISHDPWTRPGACGLAQMSPNLICTSWKHRRVLNLHYCYWFRCSSYVFHMLGLCGALPNMRPTLKEHEVNVRGCYLSTNNTWNCNLCCISWPTRSFAPFAYCCSIVMISHLLPSLSWIPVLGLRVPLHVTIKRQDNGFTDIYTRLQLRLPPLIETMARPSFQWCFQPLTVVELV